MTSNAPIVYVVDDDPAVRDSTRWLLESTRYVTRTYESAKQFLDDYHRETPGCLLLDVRMPGMSGLELQSHMAASNISLPIIIMTGHADVPMAVRALKQGAFDFLQKPFDDELLISLVHGAMDQDARRQQAQRQSDEVRRRLTGLTSREHEVLQMVVDGKSNKEMAAKLQLSPKTIEVHRAHVMSKMQADSIAQLVKTHALVTNPAECLGTKH